MEEYMEQKTTQKPKKNRRVLWLVLLLVAIILIMGGLIAWLVLRDNDDGESNDDFFDPLAMSGLLPDMSESEIREELDRVVQEGMLNIAISGDITFQDSESEGKANIANSEANHYTVKVKLTLDDTGETVYESGGIRPGQYIQYIKLSTPLEQGDYDATATFTAYTTEERQIVGSVSAKIRLYILN